MKIRSLTLQHIGVFENETIAFPEKKEKDKAEIHILTGQNGTGKTTILQALAYSILGTEPFVTYEDVNEDIIVDFARTFSKKFSLDSSLSKTILSNNYSITLIKAIQPSPKYIYIDGLNQNGENRTQQLKGRSKIRFHNPTLNSFAFSYSGYRFINHEENIDITGNSAYDPVINSLDFVKTYNGDNYSLNKWLAHTISKRANAREQEDKDGIERFNRNIKNIEDVISQIIGEDKKIKFELSYSPTFRVMLNIEGKKLDFDLLPDGLRSLISWIGDLLMRMDALKWENDLPVFEREFILFLDEIEVHLHPSWQRKVLPVVQKLFKNAQIFITTHSPFIVNSIDGAYIYELKLDADGKCSAEKPTISSTSSSIDEVLSEVYDIEPTQMYGESRTIEIEDFQSLLEKAYKRDIDFDKKKFLRNAKKLADRSPELRNNVQFELRQLSKSLAEDFTI
jgi:predicted ATP-binding protein involved in virulence